MQTFYRAYNDGRHYICSGILKRKGRGGVKMDVCRVCIKGHFHKNPITIDVTPDEAMVYSLALTACADAWLENFAPFNKWREENDK